MSLYQGFKENFTKMSMEPGDKHCKTTQQIKMQPWHLEYIHKKKKVCACTCVCVCSRWYIEDFQVIFYFGGKMVVL